MREMKQSTNGKYRYICTKYQRMRVIEDLLKQRPYKRIELARLFSVHRSMITRLINEMMLVLPVQEDEKRRVYIDAD